MTGSIASLHPTSGIRAIGLLRHTDTVALAVAGAFVASGWTGLVIAVVCWIAAGGMGFGPLLLSVVPRTAEAVFPAGVAMMAGWAVAEARATRRLEISRERFVREIAAANARFATIPD